MAETAGGPSIGGIELSPRLRFDHQPGLELPSHADLVLSLVDHQDLFDKLDKHPEADVRHRFLRERSERAHYVEWLVMVRAKAKAALEQDLWAGNVDPTDEEYLKRYGTAVVELDEALQWNSRVNEEDSKAANAPAVDPHFMDFYRYTLGEAGKSLRAPNGLPRSSYGSMGDRVPGSYFSLRDCNDDFFRRLILDKLMTPFNHSIFVPLQEFYNRMLGRDMELQSQALSQRTLDTLVMILELAVAVICFAAPVTLLYNLKSTKSRLIAAPFASFACLTPIIFLSREAKKIYTLMAGVWAVIIVIVFLSEANYNARGG